MIAFLAMLAPFLPIIFDIIGWSLKIFGASRDTLAEYQAMIDNANKEGLLSVEAHDRLLAHKKAIEERLKAREQKP